MSSYIQLVPTKLSNLLAHSLNYVARLLVFFTTIFVVNVSTFLPVIRYCIADLYVLRTYVSTLSQYIAQLFVFFLYLLTGVVSSYAQQVAICIYYVSISGP